jgi:endonuclease/exonuclease/phosphatase family metal-dependent hydrolase
MKTELPESNDNPLPQNLDQRFANRPHLRRRLLGIADMIDQAIAEGCTADEAEARAIAQIRQLGNEVLTNWAQESEADAVAKARESNSKLRPYRKKKP